MENGRNGIGFPGRRAAGALLAVAATWLLAGCGRQPTARDVTVTLSEYAFTPREITVRPGERIRFVLINAGRLDHEFESDEAGIEEVVVPPGATRRITWAAPRSPGQYRLVCDLPGHAERGMTGKIVVEETAH